MPVHPAPTRKPHLTPLLRLSQKPPLTVLSFGAGQDSAMLLALCLEDRAFQKQYIPGDLAVLMSSTGLEHPETDAYRERTAALCAERNVPFLHITPDLGFHTPSWQTLHTQWIKNQTIQSLVFPRTCSISLKLGPFYKALNALLAQRYGYPAQRGRVTRAALYAYAQDYGPVQVMIGFGKGEERRIKPTPSGFMTQTVERLFPLIDMGLTRAGCQAGTAALGFEVPMPSNCQHCPFHGPLDLLRLHRKHPESFALWSQFERTKLTAEKWQGTRNHTVKGDDRTLDQHLDAAMREFGHLDVAELDFLRHTRGHGNTTGF
ncbi:hypothetical protein [Deinococcus enclensis]|uniref:Phosphoadenosine phosphosulfate reductase family protein n=1 Tax=Deinococcus enclensis TaxID=1049582 RepID=A0ABT9MIX6_9DEIO|nr:hypothetical protein [Deinococcus enclensis]MDP9766527.1 hypothetical protein [Deinococcus enclensis]